MILLSCDEEFNELQNEIIKLSEIFDRIERYPTEEENYKNFWAQVNYTSNLFKELKLIPQRDKQPLWEEFSRLCDKAKNFRDSLTEGNASRLRDEISSLSFIRDSVKNTHLAKDRNYSPFWEKVSQIKILFKELKPIKPQDRQGYWDDFSNLCESVKFEQKEYYSIFNSISHAHCDDVMDLLKLSDVDTRDVELLKSAGQYLKKAGIALSEHKEQMTFQDKKKCFERIQEIRQTHDICWTSVKEERNRRHSDFEERTRANLQKNYERYKEANESLEYLKGKAEELQEKIDSSWNDNWASKASGWLSDLEEKIHDKQNYIRRIESWIEEDERKLR